MSTSKASTYLDSNDGADLAPARTRLLFSAWIHHGPGFPEKVEYRVGSSKCGQFDVLWIKADWDQENPTRADAWIPRRHMRGKPLHLHLLQSLFRAQKTRESANGLNLNEIASATTGLLTSKEVWDLARWVFRNDRS